MLDNETNMDIFNRRKESFFNGSRHKKQWHGTQIL